MKQNKPILHARDHLPGGADPIPGLPVATTDPPEPPGTTIPGAAPPPEALEAWHWWRFKTFDGPHPPLVQITSPDVVTNNPIYQMDFSWLGQFPGAHGGTHEVTFGHDGPNPDSTSILRLKDVDPLANPSNFFRGAAQATGAFEYGPGGKFSLIGWFYFAALENWDIFNIADGRTPHRHTRLLLTPSGGVELHRDGTVLASAGGLVSTGAWTYIAITLQSGRIKVYVNPGPPEATSYDATYGNTFAFPGPMAMETWGLENGDYSAEQLAARLKDNGFSTVALQLNGDVRPGSGRTHADYITSMAADVAALQAAGVTVVGWGVVDSTTAADLAATGVTGWMPQVEGPSQYSALNSALAAGVGAGLPKALVTTYAGLDPAKVTTLAGYGLTSAAVESYAEVGYPYNDLNRMLWQGTQLGFNPNNLIPMVGTYRGETPADYTGFDETVIANYGLYNTAQTSDAQLGEFGSVNTGTVMASRPVIDAADPGTISNSGVISIGAPNVGTSAGADGAFEGYAAEIVLYQYAINGGTARRQYTSGLYGAPGGGTVPPQAQIPPGGITPTQVAPGADGQHLVTAGGQAVWAAEPELDELSDVDTSGVADGDALTYDAAGSQWVPGAGGGGGALDDLTDVDTTGVADDDVLSYDAATSMWVSSAGTPGPTGPTGATGPTGPAGADGERWFTGSGAPAGGLAGSAVGDWYLNSANGDYYEKTGASAWTLRGNLMGPAGSGGSPGQADVQTFTSDGTWTKPSGVEVVRVICIGGGGGGAGAPGSAGAAARSGGGGGGGGGISDDTFRAADLPGTVAVTVGTGGNGGNGTTTNFGADGVNAGQSLFGSYSTAGGGGRGTGGSTGTSIGGGGGTYLSSAATSTPGTPGAPTSAGLGTQGARATGGAAGGAAEYGGAAGGGGVASIAAAGAGGGSSRAGSAGGAGAGVSATPAVGAAGAGGLAGAYAAGSGGTAGTSGASPTAGGAGGTVTGRFCGSGGGGGGSTVTAATNGANGGAGGIGSGGGGGGVSSNATGGAGGRGGDGLVIVISW